MTAPANDAGPALLSVRGLLTRYRVARPARGPLPWRAHAEVHAVEDVSFDLRAGEILALVGESGSGKSSLAQTVLRMVEPRSGRILLGGRDITDLPQRKLRPLRRRIQMIYQDPYESLDPRFRVEDAVAEPLLIHEPRLSRAERSERVARALELVGLTPPGLYAGRMPHELSGGQRQRVAVAAAMILRPDVLIADEPVSMLDVSVRVGVLRLLDSLRRSGLGIIMITHDLSTAAHFADRIAVMYLGRIVEQGPARQVIASPAHPYTRALVGAVPPADGSAAAPPALLPGEIPDATSPPPGCAFRPRCPAAVPECGDHVPPLRPAAGLDAHQAACLRIGAGGAGL